MEVPPPSNRATAAALRVVKGPIPISVSTFEPAGQDADPDPREGDESGLRGFSGAGQPPGGTTPRGGQLARLKAVLEQDDLPEP